MPTIAAPPSCSGRAPAAHRPVFGRNGQQQHQMRRGDQQVAYALTRAEKEAKVAMMKQQLEKSFATYSYTFAGVPVAKMEEMRRELPKGAKMIVAKNRLLRVAIDQIEDEGVRRLWQPLREKRGMNAYVFVEPGALKDAVQAYDDMDERLKLEAAGGEYQPGIPKPDTKVPLNTIVFEGEEMDMDMWTKITKLQSKKELLTKLAYALKSKPTRLARTIKAVPQKLGYSIRALDHKKTKLAYGVKALSELSDDKNMTVADALKARDASKGAEESS